MLYRPSPPFPSEHCSLAPYLQDGHCLGEVMLLHSGGGVQRCQGVVEFLQVAITEAPVVQVVTQTCN